MKDVLIHPYRGIGSIMAPSSKSELHRMLIAAALSDRPTAVYCNSLNDDVLATIDCIKALSAGVVNIPGGLRVTPLERSRETNSPLLECRESGSTLRFMLPVSAALGGATLTGKGRLPQRPIIDLINAMKNNGAEFSGKSLPLTVSGTMTYGTFTLPGDVSSQYVTGLMLAAPLLGECEIRIEGVLQSSHYVRTTAAVMERFGIRTEYSEHLIRIPGNQRYISPGEIKAGGDWSGAAFGLCLGALSGPVSVGGLSVSTFQGDRRIVSVLKEAGACVAESEECFTVSSGTLHGLTIDISGIPDLAPVLAALLMHAEGHSEFLNAGRLRLKESDRLKTTCAMVNALGGHASISEDRLLIEGRKGCPGGIVDGAGDHRIVMAAAIGAGACTGDSVISGADAVSKSWPSFFTDIQQAGGKFDVVSIR